jgi:uncharacterized lipoprotein YbaY
VSIVGGVTTTTARLALACLALACVLLACRRPDLEADARLEAELAGAWVRPTRDGAGVEGFDLRPRGRLEILNAPALVGAGWNVSRGELVVSAASERAAQPNASRLRIVSRSDDALVLESHEADFFAGAYRRARAEHVAGVLTYLERIALPPDARVEVRLGRGERLLARARFAPRQPVPIPFELAYLPEGGAGELALEATIAAGERGLFATPQPLVVPADANALEIVLRRSSQPE